MTNSRKLLVSAASALAISALPIKLDIGSSGGFAQTSAFAKSENGGGNGGGGNGGGGDRGNGGGKSNGSSNGKSASAAGKTKSNGGVQTASTGNLMKSIFGGGQTKKSAAANNKRTTPKTAKTKQHLKTLPANILPASVEVPGAKPVKEKNLNARLAALNSLNRNYHAYLNSQSPRMALVREYVLNSAKAELAVEAAAAAAEKAAQLQAALDAAAAAIVPFDGSAPIVDPTADALQARLDALNALEPPVDPTELAAFEAEKQALSDALAAADDLAQAEQDLADAQAAADAAAEGTSEDDLKEALLAAANPNRVAEYGDDYLNDEVMDWAKDVLGVGDAYGKIDEIKATLPTETADVTAVVDPVPEVATEPAVTPLVLPAN
ncbi:hypothetical protein [Aminobacter aminovorans]|uniref:Uncharacterized protein n=1 Tax=Aminobacter aminovorans TaxID=83263 RepID=A0AAC9ATB3_AMIAI|nr:hypothetical protein [Aminobacter aminovorans]AMS44821.1 hypothetical protein AA2016_5916 [Aminobacter aminovorans]MBB3704384.1 hypothetical protein [Aminobacter aminovorans]